MDESALRNQLSNLDALRASLHSSFRFWEWIVVVGVAFEFIVLVVEYLDERQAFSRASIRLPERPKTSLYAVAFFGILMVAGGITKELNVDNDIEKVETQIRTANDQLFGIVSKEAETADSKAKSALDKSAKVENVADQAQKKADFVELEAGAAEKRVESVAKHADLLQAQQEFRGPREELFVGNNVTRPGLGKFMEKVRPFIGQKIEIRTNFSEIRDPQDRQETQALTTTLQFLLGQVSGWVVSIGEGGHNWGVDVVISRKAPLATRKAADAMASGLGDVGLTGMQRQKPEVVEAQEGSETDRTNFAPDTILLFVGQHP